MSRRRCLLAVACLALVSCAPTAPEPEPVSVAASDWPWWRGPNRDGIARPDQDPPLKWSETENVIWKAPVPGRAHGSAIVVGSRVFFPAADPESEIQSVLCFDRDTGKQLWKTDIHQGGFTTKGNAKSTQGSATPACDGERVFVNFLNSDAVYTTALSLDGKQLWQRKVTDYVVHQGFGSSPTVYGPLVIVSADNKGGGRLMGLNRVNGEVVWQHSRPKMPNYASPIIVNVVGKEQLIFTGTEQVVSLEPLTGKVHWEFEGSTTETVTSVVTDGERVFITGGYPKNHVAAVRADGSGKIDWEHGVRVYVPSMVAQDGHIFAVQDGGIAICWKAATGEERWKERLGGAFSSSPVLVGNRIYVTNERGTTFVYKADPEKFELLAENRLGDEGFATPTFVDSRVYMRVAMRDQGKRQEWLYCLGIADQGASGK